MKDKNRLVWLYANGCYETLDIIDSISKSKMNWINQAARNKYTREYSIWERMKNYLANYR